MPELPEVETIRRQLEPLVVGRAVVAGGGHPSVKFASAQLAVGTTITSTNRRGKYLLLGLGRDRELVIHLGMTGAISLRRTGEVPDPYVRAWWALGPRASPDPAPEEVLELRDIRRFGRVAVVPAGAYGSLPTLDRLGPEPLGREFTADRLYRDLGRSVVRVKTQLLHQRVVAGVGNIYADEALWAARINPAVRRVSRARAGALHAALREVIASGIDHGGTRLRDYRSVDGDTGTNQHHLRCYGRAGRPCLRCATTLRRRLVDARGTTWCPECQRR